MDRPIAIDITGLVCRLNGITALDGVSLAVPAATLLGLVGPNGAGKTTLLRAIAGTVSPSAGRVLVDGRKPHATPAAELARVIAVLPQHPVVPRGITVREAVAWGRAPHLGRFDRLGVGDLAAIDEALAKTGTRDLADRLVEKLSGGERQRVLIARAMAQAPRLLLLDEPTAHLDLAHQFEVMEVLRALARGGITIVVAVHDLALAAAYCDQLAVLAGGHLVAYGKPAQVATEATIMQAYGTSGMARLQIAGIGTGGRDRRTSQAALNAIGGGDRRMPARKPVIAIDGPTAAGKSTVARAVAQRLGLRYLETGAMYRAVALAALRQGVVLADAEAVARVAEGLAIEFRPGSAGNRIIVDGEDVTEAIRTREVSEAASVVSVAPGVRAAMVARQKAMGAEGGVVMEGRDIGTVVFPDAEVKVFLRASLEARARRRYDELRARGADVDLDAVRRSEAERDQRDETRALSPLRPAPDAVTLDSTTVSVDDVIETIVRLVRERTGVV